MDVVWLNIIIELFTEIYYPGTSRENRSSHRRTEGPGTGNFYTEEIQDEILETSCLISRFINLTLSDKKFTEPPSPTIPEYTATTSHPSVEY